jgi:hypothetical protein
VSVDDPRSETADSYTFVLVHGGCHDGSLWQPVVERLEQLGHTAYRPTVAGHNQRVRRLAFWSAYVLNDGQSALEMLPDTIELPARMAADSADNTFMIPFEMWRGVHQ